MRAGSDAANPPRNGLQLGDHLWGGERDGTKYCLGGFASKGWGEGDLVSVDTASDAYGEKLQSEFSLDPAKLSGRNRIKLTNFFVRVRRRRCEVRFRPQLAILALLLAPILSSAVDLKPETLQAWDVYIRAAQMRMEERARGQRPFLWVDENADRVERARGGEVLVEPRNGDSPHSVSHGLIHDWVGAVFVARAKLDDVMGVLNDYERYKDFYRPMVVKSTLLEQTPDQEKVSLLMMQKAFSVTAAVETEDQVQIRRLDADRVYSISTSVHVREIADYGQPSEHALPEGRGPGYVWRTFTVTRLEQRDGGVYAEIESIDLSRGIPWAFHWLIKPLAEHLPRSILETTLKDTRDAVNQEAKRARVKTEPVTNAAPDRPN